MYIDREMDCFDKSILKIWLFFGMAASNNRQLAFLTAVLQPYNLHNNVSDADICCF